MIVSVDSSQVDITRVWESMQYCLTQFGFKKENDQYWYCDDSVQILSLWACYEKWIYTQPMYNLFLTMPTIPKIVLMLEDETLKRHVLLFDYQYRRIVLVNIDKREELKIKTLHIGNPKKLSLEFNVHIQWLNHDKKPILILNHSWKFFVNVMERIALSSCCA
ncbi:hypothetical protein RFI_24956, partial [Reticulomyxa filosa]